MLSGYKPEEIYDIFKKYCTQINYVSISNIIKLILGIIFEGKIIIQGLNNGNKIEHLMKNLCKDKNIHNINQIKFPLIIPSVDLHTGKTYIFSSLESRSTYNDNVEYINDIDICTAVRASCSYPGIFAPCKYLSKELIDGGIRENIPWKETKKLGADKVISVVFEEEFKKEDYFNINIIEVIGRSIGILSHELSNYELMGADELLKIKTNHMSLLDSSKIDYLYKLGYKEAKRHIKKLNY